MCVILGSRPCVNEGFALLECYAALMSIYRRFGTAYRSLQQVSSSGNSLSTSRSKVKGSKYCLTLEDGRGETSNRYQIYSNKNKAKVFTTVAQALYKFKFSTYDTCVVKNI
jgi:hypothetical protein